LKKLTYISLFIFVIIGIFSDFIANDKPILCKDNSGFRFPIFERNFILESGCKVLLNPIIKYSHKTIDQNNSRYVSPFAKQQLFNDQQRHFLGTDQLGRDVLAGIIHGTTIVLKIGFISMFLALLLGLAMSLYPSYYGDHDFKASIGKILFTTLLIVLFSYYFLYFDIINSIILINEKGFTILTFVLISIFILYYIFKKVSFFKKRISIPLDSIFSIIIKIFQSLPGSFIIIILISLFTRPSIYNIIIVIAILKWPIIAKYVRSEMMKIKEESFIDSSKTLGLSNNLIIWKHTLPHVLTPVIVALSFGFSGTILLESTLSFLGIGIPADHVSWGSLLSEARHNFSAWWLAVFPGFAIFFTIFLFNNLGNIFMKKITKT